MMNIHQDQMYFQIIIIEVKLTITKIRLKNSAITDMGLGDKLTRIIQTYMKERSLNLTLQAVVREACKVFGCGYARIIISNKLLVQCNSESEGYFFISQSSNSPLIDIQMLTRWS